MSRMTSWLAAAHLLLVLVLGFPGPTHANDFVDGASYIQALDGATGLTIVRHIDPVAGTQTDASPIMYAVLNGISYDPFRDRLLLCGFQIDSLFLVDFSGVLTSIDYSWSGAAWSMAPTGDGRIYLGSNDGRLGYLDECDEFHEVLHPDCDVPFVLEGSALQQLFYDPGANLLYAADGIGNVANIHRIELSPDGTRATGVIDSNSYFVSSSGHGITGLNAGPTGSLLMSVDTNDNDIHPRLLTIDPLTLEFSIFAETESASQHGAAYDPVSELVYMPIFNSTVNAVAEGTVGNGTVVVSGTGQVYGICMIGQTVGANPTLSGSGDCNGNGLPDACDLASGTSNDCNQNGIPDECDIASGTSNDSDGDGIPDECDAPDPVAYAAGDIFVGHLNGGGEHELLRVDPVTGCVTAHALLSGSTTAPTYDPFRDAVVLRRPTVDELVFVSYTGDVSMQGYDWVGNETGLAPTGDGRIFIGNGSGEIAMLDVCGVVTGLVDGAGDPFVGPSTCDRLIYDYDAQVLYAADGLGNVANIHRIPLSEDGTQVIGPVQSSSFFVSPSGHAITGLSAGPAGTLLMSVDTNDNDPHPRLLLVDLVDLTIVPYAETATGAQLGASYHPDRDQALIANNLTWSVMAFDAGDAPGDGETLSLSPIVNPTGLIVIGQTVIGSPPAPIGAEDCNGNGFLDACDLALGTSLDCNDNDVPDECDISSGFSVDTNGNDIPDECETPFLRGDVDGGGSLAINDAILLLNYQFQGGTVLCVDACDLDDDGTILLNDVTWLLIFMFQSGPPPAAPFPGCGLDPSLDGGGDLGCDGPLPGCP